MAAKRRGPKPTLKRRVLGYIRVSTTEQAKEGLSLYFQKRKIEFFCELHDLILVKVIEDPGFSGKDLNRPGLRELLELIPDPTIHGVVVYRLDRLSRSTRDLLEMVDDVFAHNEADFYSVTEKVDTTTALGKFFLTIIGALAQMERDLIGERTQAGMEETRLKGTHLGGVPLGYQRDEDKKLIPLEQEQLTLARVKELRGEGLSLRAIASALTEEGHPTKKGGAWHPQTVKLILARTES